MLWLTKCPTPLAASSQHSDLFLDRKGSKVLSHPSQAMAFGFPASMPPCNVADPCQSLRAPRSSKAKWPSTKSLPYPLT